MMRFDRFTERAQESAQRAAEIIQRYGHNQIDSEHFALALVEQPGGAIPQILEKLSVSAEALTERLDATLRAAPKANIFGGGAGKIFITPRVKRLIDLANEESLRLKDDFISTEHLFLAILTERNTPVARILESAGLTRERVNQSILDLRGGQRQSSSQTESRYQILGKYFRNLTQIARGGKIEPILGRDNEILRLIQALQNRTKNNPVLIGDAGIGKSSIITGLAQKIADGDVPEFLIGIDILLFDINAMMADLESIEKPGEYLIAAFQEIRSIKDKVIIVVDELHDILIGQAKGWAEFQKIFRSVLSHDEMRVIGTTTLDDFSKRIEKDNVLERKLVPIKVEELTVDNTIKLLFGLRDQYEAHHKVYFSDEALIAAVQLASRHVTDRRFPNKALDLVDEAASKVRLKLFSEVPSDLKLLKKEVERLSVEEEQAGKDRDYELAAQKKAERLQIEYVFNEKHDKWMKDHGIDEVVHIIDVAEVIHQWTGVPVNQIMSRDIPAPSEVIEPRVMEKSSYVNYLDFNVKIIPHEKAGFYKVNVSQSPAGEANSEFTFPLSNVEIENLILRLLKLRSATRRIDSPEMSAARKLGTALFQSVFQGQIRDVFRVSLQKARSEKSSGLRIKLRLQNVPELANLPWEFLFDSDMQNFLAQSVQTPIVRYMELAETALPLKVTLPLQVLGIISNPSDYAVLDVQKEKTSLHSALSHLIKAGLVKITWLEDATIDSLRKALSLQNFHILHFIGHGGLDKRAEQGVLVFTDSKGKGIWVDAERLGVLLYDHPSLRLVILNACEGARNTIRDPFSGVATTLVRRGIPAVAAMQFEISDTAAVTFSADFYAALAAGFPVDAAIAEARKAVYFMPNDIEWGTPVLYLRAPDGVLFEFPK